MCCFNSFKSEIWSAICSTDSYTIATPTAGSHDVDIEDYRVVPPDSMATEIPNGTYSGLYPREASVNWFSEEKKTKLNK